MHTILVVDDDHGVRQILRRVMEDMGHHVEEAKDAETALDLLARCKVHLALCDIRMPGRDGVWLIDQILSRFPGTPVAVATGLHEMDATVTLRAGVVGYVTKPFRKTALAELVTRALATPAAPPARPSGPGDLIVALDAL